MPHSIQLPRLSGEKWVYASLLVHDGDRALKPSHVGPDHIRFAEPPRLINSQVEIIIENGDEEQREMVTVLPHDAEATKIPIRSITAG